MVGEWQVYIKPSPLAPSSHSRSTNQGKITGKIICTETPLKMPTALEKAKEKYQAVINAESNYTSKFPLRQDGDSPSPACSLGTSLYKQIWHDSPSLYGRM